MNQKVIITYPQEWENEYKSTRFVSLWRETYPNMFAEYRGSAKLGWLDLFPQYALMFLLRRDHGIHSVTWYKLAGNNDIATVPEVIQKRWRIMRQWMGSQAFDALQDDLREQKFRQFKGEPDLFCWNPVSRYWFFAEAKRKDSITEPEQTWSEICKKTLGDLADIRVYRLVPES